MTERLSQFSNNSIFASLSDTTNLALATESVLRCYRKRQFVYYADQRADDLYFVLSGRLKLTSISQLGREVILHVIGPYEICGENGVAFPNETYRLNAETLEPSEVCVFRRTTISSALSDHPKAASAMMQLIASRRNHVEEILSDILFLDTKSRLAKLLLNLCAALITDRDAPTKYFPIDYTARELAKLIGATYDSTVCCLSDFRRLGIIQETRGKVIVINWRELEALSSNRGRKSSRK